MAEDFPIKRPASLSKIAEQHIRRSIVSGAFHLGEALSEAKLSKALGISKTPIREALAALQLQGLVQIRPQRGAVVFSLSQESVEQLCRYRMLLEEAALDQSLELNPSGLLDELDEIVVSMSKAQAADAFEQYLDLDAAFHDAFFRYCGNTFLEEGYRKVSDIVGTMRTHLSKRSDRTEKSFAEHEAIVSLLRKGKREAAKEVLKRQITRGERSYSDLIGVNSP